jgi:hypothetical protein
MEKISELVWLYIKRRPFLKEILREGITNYSALARKICMEAFGNIDHESAVKMALVRLSNKIGAKEEDLEGRILKVLGDSSISILNKVAVVVTTKEIDVEPLSVVEGKKFFTYIMEEKEMKKIRKTKSILLTKINLNLITIHSSPELEEVPGVISHILNALASEGINVVEFVSCYTDTLLVIKQADTTRAFEILSAITS